MRAAANDPNTGALGEALETGPFDHALALAIAANGLSLMRLKHRLDTAGCPVSITTLSNWRAGRNLPERPGSLRAVPVLERVLGLPDGSLTTLLSRGVAQTKPARPEAVRWDRLWDRRSLVIPTLHSFEAAHDTALLAEYVHDELHVDENRLLRRAKVREIVRACEAEAQVKIVTMRGMRAGRPPRLVSTRFCRPGRVETSHDDGFTVAELVLEDWLDEGETAIVEYEFEYTDTVSDTYFDRRFRHTVANYVLEVHFPEHVLPVSCVAYRKDTPAGPELDLARVPIRPGTPSHLVKAALPAGICGLRWAWEDRRT
ncbi:hypothetical protein ACIA2T_23430 [Amycolatopsis japonica]|uniref:hypothetical protein n=1 Tax=Amycolatopsis japonica TaxID=208439 RepID=UPI0037A628A3